MVLFLPELVIAHTTFFTLHPSSSSSSSPFFLSSLQLVLTSESTVYLDLLWVYYAGVLSMLFGARSHFLSDMTDFFCICLFSYTKPTHIHNLVSSSSLKTKKPRVSPSYLVPFTYLFWRTEQNACFPLSSLHTQSHHLSLTIALSWSPQLKVLSVLSDWSC